MKKIKILFILFFFFILSLNLFLQEQEKKEEPVPDETNEVEIDTSQNERAPVVKYIIDARLFPEKSLLEGTEILTWVNKSPVPVDNLRFHLYYNAFSSPDTTFFREGELYKKTEKELRELKFGGIEITRIRLIGGDELTGNIQFVSPDDGNAADKTVMQVNLKKTAAPLQRISLEIRFELKIPDLIPRSRTGKAGTYFFMGQWFPKIGVLRQDGQWHCHQYHRLSEFFADYGDYKVSITVPKKFVVGASGNLIKSEKTGSGGVTYFYEETNIHDFAWTAYPRFKKILEKVTLAGNPRETTIELLLSPRHGGAKQRYIKSLKFALDFYAKHIFPYPYKKITVVDPPLKGMMSGGMEYPTLITLGHIGFLPESLKFPEQVTIHEFSHQYWYGIVGSDEFREAWLDEGVTTFFEMEILDEYFKNSPSFLDSNLVKIDYWEFVRLRLLSLLPVDKPGQYSWAFLNSSQYDNNVYAKAGLLLRSLKNHIGKNKIYDFFKFYAEKYKFKHPTTEDFIETFNEFMDEDFTWAFEQFIKSETGLDHSVYSVKAAVVPSRPGMFRSEAVFLRKEGYFPVELAIQLENGKRITSFWKKQEKWKRFVTINASPVDYAVIDPEFKVVLDKNFLDNSKVRRPGRSGIKKLAFKFGSFFQSLLGFLIF
ncbi:MAG: M1 family metallopeptidase [Candidatus Aminicenantes bacterium]|nr:M1 family metallopeptidase [Candidatus Aminicenantes bacterium]